jgi:multicomponent Na+:H+ antiporter subunit C
MALEGPGRWRVSFLPYVVVVWLLLIGLYGIVTSRHLVHLIVCLTVVQSSSYVLLLAIGYRTGAEAPIYKDIPPETPVVDSVVQALTLTDVVVEATVAALLLALAVQAQKRFGTVDPDEIVTLKG